VDGDRSATASNGNVPTTSDNEPEQAPEFDAREIEDILLLADGADQEPSIIYDEAAS
jgi:hypothetical protein